MVCVTCTLFVTTSNSSNGECYTLMPKSKFLMNTSKVSVLMALSRFAKMSVICLFFQQLAPMITNLSKSVKLMPLRKVMTIANWLISTVTLIISTMDSSIPMLESKSSMKFSRAVVTVLSPSASISAMR